MYFPKQRNVFFSIKSYTLSLNICCFVYAALAFSDDFFSSMNSSIRIELTKLKTTKQNENSVENVNYKEKKRMITEIDTSRQKGGKVTNMTQCKHDNVSLSCV